jgi:aryl-alcohol dehydrogenase-like predicted oxidoreductase
MEYTKLGATGLDVSPICLGTALFSQRRDGEYVVDRDRAHELLDAAFDAGINFFDTANIYGDPAGTSEEWLGDWLDGVDREEVVLASKVRNPMGEGANDAGLGRKHVRAQLEASLERLGTDYLDVYYIHRWDDETPIVETLRTFEQFVREGTVHHLGASTTAAWKLTKALWKSDAEGLERFAVTQPKYNAAYRAEVADYLAVCEDQNLAVCPYRPLEGGFLTGKYGRDGDVPAGSRGDRRSWSPGDFSERQWAVLAAIRDVADDVDATVPQVALRWLIEQDTVPITTARSVEHLAENAAAADLSLSAAHVERIDEAYATAGE